LKLLREELVFKVILIVKRKLREVDLGEQPIMAMLIGVDIGIYQGLIFQKEMGLIKVKNQLEEEVVEVIQS
jgi:hypothetical protein